MDTKVVIGVGALAALFLIRRSQADTPWGRGGPQAGEASPKVYVDVATGKAYDEYGGEVWISVDGYGSAGPDGQFIPADEAVVEHFDSSNPATPSPPSSSSSRAPLGWLGQHAQDRGASTGSSWVRSIQAALNDRLVSFERSRCTTPYPLAEDGILGDCTKEAWAHFDSMHDGTPIGDDEPEDAWIRRARW